jgi:hypothetical protein
VMVLAVQLTNLRSQCGARHVTRRARGRGDRAVSPRY